MPNIITAAMRNTFQGQYWLSLAITGYFYEFWRWIENKNKVKKNESIDFDVCLFEFRNSIQ